MPLPSILTRTIGIALPLSPISQLLQELHPESRVMLRKLASVLTAPIDTPALLTVLSTATKAVDSYGKTLVNPTDEFRNTAEMLKTLTEECCRNRRLSAAADPLRRRLMKSPAWALLLEMSKVPTPQVLLSATGVELAYCLATTKNFPIGYATNLRRALGPALDFLRPAGANSEGEPTWLPHFRKVSREARKLFDSGTLPPDNDLQSNFNVTVISTLRSTSLLPDTRHRQGILDHSHLSPAMLVESAAAIRDAAVSGCDDSILAILAFLSGLPLTTTYRIPLAGSADDWVMELDVEAGVLRTDLDLVFDKSARPRDASAHRPAGRVIAKPLPKFLANALLLRLHETPEARFVADLLPRATCKGGKLVLTDNTFGIEPSLARFIHSAPCFAIQRGVDRLAAAALTNDFSIVPAAKVYYCHLDRHEIWAAAELLYGDLGWGTSAPYVEGMGFGSRVIPTRNAIRGWYQWLNGDLRRLMPGRNCTISSLLAFHNRFAEACAAITVFCLASRGTARIQLSADELTEHSECVLMFDKRVGQLPRPLPVPVNAIVAMQAGLWFAHCRALDKRLAHKGLNADLPLRQRLNGVTNLDRVEIFFLIDDKLRPQPISSNRLVHAWPAEFGFDPDFGRHFWQSELRLAGVKSTVIDLLQRHQIVGIEGHRSTADRSLASCFAEIVKVQERILAELDIKPLIGLAKS